MVIRLISGMIALATFGQLVAPLLRDTNSSAEVRRGIAWYENRKHEEALRSFAAAAELRPDPLTSFDLGTAHVAARNFADGARHLSEAMKSPPLRPDALYNRGNSALSANALDYAIRDYVSALKLRPGDRDTKRNLEIALLRKQAAQQSQPQQQQQQQTPQQDQDQQQQRPQPSPGDQREQQKEEADADALLRSVEQQEREELSRMRRARSDPGRIGW